MALASAEAWAAPPPPAEGAPRAAAEAPRPPPAEPPRRTTDELVVLYLNSAVYGLGTGSFIGALEGRQRFPDFNLAGLAVAGLGVGGVALADGMGVLRYGMPEAIVSGMALGLGEGLTWSLWQQAVASEGNAWSTGTAAAVMWGTTTLGAVAGGVAGAYGLATPGRAGYVASTGLWSSAVFGLTASWIGNGGYGTDDRPGAIVAAVGLNLGAATGVLTASEVSPSIARVRYLDLGGIAGGLVGGLGAVLTAGQWAERGGGDVGVSMANLRAVGGVSALGSAVGLGVAWWATSGMAPDRGPAARAAGAVAVHPWWTPLPGGGASLGLMGQL